MYKATHVKGQDDLFIVFTFKEFLWGDSTLHCNYVLPLRRALGQIEAEDGLPNNRNFLRQKKGSVRPAGP